MKLCLGCGADIGHSHHNVKRCKACASEARRRSGRAWARRNYVLRKAVAHKCLDCDDMLDNYQAQRCPTCAKKHSKEREKRWRAENLGHVMAYEVSYRPKKNEQRRANKTLQRERDRVTRIEHPEIHRAKKAKRRAAKKSAMPCWADPNAIRDIYRRAALEGKHVDHIVPLQHPLVCGLHIAANLQLLTPEENMRKGNTLDERILNTAITKDQNIYQALDAPI